MLIHMGSMGIKIAKKVIHILLMIYGGFVMSEEVMPYEKYVDQIIHELEREMAREHGLICIGSGGSMPTNVVSIKLVFNVYKRGSIQEARELMVKAKTRLIAKVNAHEKIRPYLQKYPFPPEGANISLWFQKKDGSYYLDDSVVCAGSARGGKIAYSKVELQTRQEPGIQYLDGRFEPGKFTEDEVFIRILDEPYEETVRLAQLKQFIK
jgi:hypothetical protein